MSTCPSWKKRVKAVNAGVSSHLCLIAVEAGNKADQTTTLTFGIYCYHQSYVQNGKTNECEQLPIDIRTDVSYNIGA